jgi:hypothetical protein
MARVLSLPMANDLSEDAIDAIVRCLISAAVASRPSGGRSRPPAGPRRVSVMENDHRSR